MKILLVCCVVFGCGCFGYCLKRKFEKQLNALKEIKNYCVFIKDNLYLFKNNIEEININYINTQKNKNANNFILYQNNHNNMQKYIKFLLNNVYNIELSTLVEKYFIQVGKSDYQGEIAKLNELIFVVDREIDLTKNDCKQKGDLYFKLSLAVGVVIGVLIW